jgi:1-acyl-sn-glycerol-3-phosphate acyltransferase
MKEIEHVPASERLIDIEALFETKNPRLLKIIPGFVIRYLKRITHQDTVNAYIYRHRDKTGLPFVEAILGEFGVRIKVAGNDPFSVIQPDGRYIIASNHPLGGIDGMVLMKTFGKVRGDIVFPVNDLLMSVPGLRPLFIPINKHGKNKENARLIDETFASDRVILFFPAGLVSRKQKIGGKTVIMDLDWKNTFIKKAKKYRRDIIPVYVDGRNSDWFYNLSVWRKRLGIGANIEMLYLVDEMMKQFNKTTTLVVGKPIPYTSFDSSRTDVQWATWMKDHVYSLNENAI